MGKSKDHITEGAVLYEKGEKERQTHLQGIGTLPT